MSLILKDTYVVADWTDDIRKRTGTTDLNFYYAVDNILWEDTIPILVSHNKFEEGDKIEGKVIIRTFKVLDNNEIIITLMLIDGDYK